MFNVEGYKRARAIVSSYRRSEDRVAPLSATILASRFVLNDDLPLDIRQFYSVYSTSTKKPTAAAVDIMLAYHEKYQQYDSYLRLCYQPSDDLQALLHAAGLIPRNVRVGRTHSHIFDCPASTQPGQILQHSTGDTGYPSAATKTDSCIGRR